jgi:hypothetical protein
LSLSSSLSVMVIVPDWCRVVVESFGLCEIRDVGLVP